MQHERLKGFRSSLVILIQDASFSAVAAALESDDITRGKFPGVCFEYAILREIAGSNRREAI